MTNLEIAYVLDEDTDFQFDSDVDVIFRQLLGEEEGSGSGARRKGN